MKTIYLTAAVWTLAVAAGYGQAETDPTQDVGWRLVESTDTMTDRLVKRAVTMNKDGHLFAIFRAQTGGAERGDVYGYFSLSKKSAEVLGSTPPIYRIDKLKAHNLEEEKRISRDLGVGYFSNSTSVSFVLFARKGEPTEGTDLRDIMEGKTILFRYYLLGGESRETSFDLSGARPVIASAIGVSADSLQEIKAKAEEARLAAEKGKQEARLAAEKARQDAEMAKQAAIQAAKKRIEDAKRRTWTSADGRFTVDAKFVGVISGVVSLEKDDGQRINVNQDRLSQADQDFIRNRKWLEQPPSPAPSTPERAAPAIASGTPAASTPTSPTLTEPTARATPASAAATQRPPLAVSSVADAIVRLTFEPDTMTKTANGKVVVRDLSECRNDALADGATATTGRLGTAIAFDGKDDFITFHDLAKDFKGVRALTVGTWIRAGDLRRDNFVLDMRSEDGKQPWVLRLMFNKQEIAFSAPGSQVVGRCNLSGRWHHVVGTWADGITRLYLDGKQLAEEGDGKGTITDAMLANCSAYLGRQVVGFYGPRPKNEPRGLVGALDEFFVLRRALSPDELAQLFADNQQ